jgi:hypothetical protein
VPLLGSLRLDVLPGIGFAIAGVVLLHEPAGQVNPR